MVPLREAVPAKASKVHQVNVLDVLYCGRDELKAAARCIQKPLHFSKAVVFFFPSHADLIQPLNIYQYP